MCGGAYDLGDLGAYDLLLEAVNMKALTNLSILNPVSKSQVKTTVQEDVSFLGLQVLSIRVAMIIHGAIKNC